MRYVEIIEVRAQGRHRLTLESHLNLLLKDDHYKHEVSIFYNRHFKDDISLHLVNESKEIGQNGSALGMHLASALKNFGIVNHTIWIRKQPTEKTK